MMVLTAKLKKRNLLIILLAAIAVLAILLWPSGKDTASTASQVTDKAETNDQRIAFLENFGWKVDADPEEMQEVRIPDDNNEVFVRYNELQKSQGYDLSQYAGKTVKRYVYEIENYPGNGDYDATIFVYKGRIIGGDVASDDPNGTMHGFEMPS